MPLEYISKLTIPKRRLRKVSQEKVDELAKSIQNVGQLNPVLTNIGVVIAGAHRVLAMKQLGRDQVNITFVGDERDPDNLTLIEIDENLVRAELTAAEKAEHISLKVDILAKRELSSLPHKTPGLGGKRGNISDEEQEEREKRAAATKAKKEAKKQVADSLGHKDSTHVSASINDDAAVKKAGLDPDKLDQLSPAQFKDVAKTARTDKAEAAKQLDAIIEEGGKASAKLSKSDSTDYIKEQVKQLQNAVRAISRLQKSYHADDKKLCALGEDVKESIAAYQGALKDKFGLIR